MGKRVTSLRGGVKSKRSHKTKKRLEIKHAMLTAKAVKKSSSKKKKAPSADGKKKVAKKVASK
ncbi:MAG: hypothetical protein QG674_440 [Patescibacteria group bacterium]|jgi:hypothetical protein|nr:hypothetical protein [Patescibacteria group bacterium]